MQYKNIPHTDLRPSALCFGSVTFGSALDASSAFRLLDIFFEQGGTFLDTAHVYGAWVPNGLGLSERVIGQWMKERHVRQRVVLATKGAHPELTSPHIPRLAPQEIVADLDASLRSLQTDTIDLYWLHRDDPQRPVAEIIETLKEQVGRGKIRYFGCSNWHVERIEEAQRYAASQGSAGFVGNQLLWSLAVPNRAAISDPTMVLMDAPTLKFHQTSGLPIVAYTAQANGFFSKASDQAVPLSEALAKKYASAENTQRLQRLQKVSQDLSLPLAVLALAYLTNQSALTFPIFGASSPAQLRENLPAGDVELSAEIVRYLESGE